MSIVKLALVASVFATLAGAAGAAPARFSDGDYVSANRCLGLLESKTLGNSEVTAMKAVVEAQESGREDLARLKGDEVRSDAKAEADRSTGDLKLRLIAERDGACQAWLPATQTSAVSSPARSD